MTVHLAFHELQAVDVSFGLSVLSGVDDGRAHGGRILGDAPCEGAYQAGFSVMQPRIEIAFGLAPTTD